MKPASRHLWIAALLCASAACTPEPPSTERRPEPQAAERHTELRDAIQAPQDKARAVEEQTRQAADAQRAAIEAQAR